MEALFPVLLFVGFIGLFFFLAKVERDRKARIAAMWADLAHELDGEFMEGDTSWWSGSSPNEIWADLDGIEVHVDTVTRGSGKNQRTYTRIRAAATADSVQLKVYREHAFSGFARAVGFQDVVVGDTDFDQSFMVKASDEMFAKAWLNKTVRKRIFAAPDYQYVLKRGRVTAEKHGVTENMAALESAMRAVAAYADGKHHVVRVFRKLAKRLGGKAKKESEGWASLEADVDGIPVDVDTVEHGTTHYCVASAHVLGAKLTPLVITNDPHEFSPALPSAEMHDLPEGYGAWTAEPQRASAQLTEAVKKSVDKLQPIKLRIDDDRVRVYLVGICPPLTRMHQAVKLAATIAAGATQGPYR